ncbi:hypothetical protein BDFB_013524 [Asbolus verrucosus]|uniref:Uncharacterized protein n=1 Tax=Asbolus verrucosus TaxID=1661398 RepID=A0A482VL42_ASBVE|nr:hypothetical protein BDFB_013524 [Asbolus verrucosus]
MLGVATLRVSRHAARGRHSHIVPMAVQHLIFALSLPALFIALSEAVMDVTAGKFLSLICSRLHFLIEKVQL